MSPCAINAVTVLTNPNSGHGTGRASSAVAVARLRERGLDVTEVHGTSGAQSLELAGRAVESGTDALVAAGGDGLISAVLQAVATTPVPFGIIPGGTGNDHARLLRIPLGDPAAAADIVAAGVTRQIDLGRAEGTWFGTVLASGFDSLVTHRANRLRWPKGRMRYNAAILAELMNLKPIPYRIELDGETIEVAATLVAVGNGTSYGGGMLVCPRAQLDDGLLDVTVIEATSRGRLIRLMPTLYRGTHVELDRVRTYRCRSIRLDAPGITSDADGEPLAPLPVTATAVARAAHVLVP
ncbi:MAG: diacylglycerol kinase [Sciscionella sp.]